MNALITSTPVVPAPLRDDGGTRISDRIERRLWRRRHGIIATLAAVGVAVHLVLRFAGNTERQSSAAKLSLIIVLVVGGIPLVLDLLFKVARRQFGSDLLAGLSIVTAAMLGQYLPGVIVVLMLSGGEALEAFAVRRASSVLRALANRMPSIAHRRQLGRLSDVSAAQVAVGDTLVVFPHELCPVDGEVVEGHGDMDESYLTGEPFRMSKTPGSAVLSGSINGEHALTIRAAKIAGDSRFARIMQVMRAGEKDAPRLRRLGDQLGAWYTPLAVLLAIGAWGASGQPTRFLAVLVVATPCPLLIAIPTAIIGSISLSARRGIIVKKPAVLEQVSACRTLIFDKTGTLTYGRPAVAEVLIAPGFDRPTVLSLAASLERFSKHPLARAVLNAAEQAGVPLRETAAISERPGEGLRGNIGDRSVQITSRKLLARQNQNLLGELPPSAEGMECVIVVDDRYAGTIRFRDEPRIEGASFVGHLGPRHNFERLMLVSGDRLSEVQYLAQHVGIHEVHAGKSPEEKLEIVKQETRRAPTLYLGDGINDAPALQAATVGVALGQNSDITSEAAGAVILDSSLRRVDEFLHISRRMRRIALQSAVGGMGLSVVGMLMAAAGLLPPIAGAIAQEVIDVFAVLNALRAALPPRAITDF